MPATAPLLLEKDGAIGWIIFNQPEKRNAVSQEMWQLIPEYVEDLERDDAIRVVILRGAGDAAFVSGADISQFKDRRRNMADEAEYRKISARGAQALTGARSVRRCQLPGRRGPGHRRRDTFDGRRCRRSTGRR